MRELCTLVHCTHKSLIKVYKCTCINLGENTLIASKLATPPQALTVFFENYPWSENSNDIHLIRT